MLPSPHFRGPMKYRLRSAQIAAQSLAVAATRRLRRGPRMPGWNWAIELGTAVIRNQLISAFKLATVAEQRRFLDSLVLDSPVAHQVSRKQVESAHLSGTWYLPNNSPRHTVLYLHGGGFSLYPRDSYANLVALVAIAADASTFALDYRLAPEFPFPAALNDARSAYLWLIEHHCEAHHLVVAGDSAGGNLTLSLLCDLRDRNMPLPALGIALSPATEFDTIRPSMSENEPSDWITGPMALTWRDLYCSPDERSHPLVSPIHANLRDLPPIYIQAGRSEILYDSIAAFAVKAKEEGADVRFESWPSMNHVFQFFGYDAPQSAEALQRIGAVVAETVRQKVTF